MDMGRVGRQGGRERGCSHVERGSVGKPIILGALQGSSWTVFRPLIGAPNGEGEKDRLTP